MADLASESPLVRRQSAEFLGQCAPKAVLAVPALIRALNDSDVTVRCASAGALARFGAAARAALPALARRANDDDDRVRRSAAAASSSILADTR
jgi:HEAT repeat protein